MDQPAFALVHEEGDCSQRCKLSTLLHYNVPPSQQNIPAVFTQEPPATSPVGITDLTVKCDSLSDVDKSELSTPGQEAQGDPSKEHRKLCSVHQLTISLFLTIIVSSDFGERDTQRCSVLDSSGSDEAHQQTPLSEQSCSEGEVLAEFPAIAKKYGEKRGTKRAPTKGKGPAPKQPHLETFNFDRFHKYLTSVAGGMTSQGQARKYQSDVRKYLKAQTRRSATRDANLLLNVASITAWLEEQRSRNLAMSTLLNKVYSMSAAIKYLRNMSTFREDARLEHKSATVLADLNSWKTSLRRKVKKENTRRLIREEQEVEEAPDALSALDRCSVKETVDAAIARLSRDFNADDAKLLQGYAAGLLIYTNAQRSGIVTNMVIRELKMHKQHGDSVIINVVEHKTTAQGAVALAIDKTKFQYVIAYYKLVRKRIVAVDRNLKRRMFLTLSGREMTNVNRTLQAFAARVGVSLPTATLHRKVISTEGAAELEDHQVRQLAVHMSHTVAVARRHYQLRKGREQAAETHRVIKALARNRQPSTRRKCWSAKKIHGDA